MMLPIDNITIDQAANEDFDEQRDFNPTYPTHDTHAARLLAVVLLGTNVEPLDGWRALGIYRLADAKYRLIQKDWPMESNRLHVSNQFGEQCRVANYALPQWAIEFAGERGRAFAEHEIRLMNERRAS
jgi:hypothetical protein